MNLEEDDLIHFGVLWSVQGADEFGVQRVVAPVEFICRWRLGSTLVDSPTSNTKRIVGSAAVAQEIPLGAIVWRGRLADLPPAPTPLMQVSDYKVTDDVKGRNSRKRIILTAWNSKLPPAVT